MTMMKATETGGMSHFRSTHQLLVSLTTMLVVVRFEAAVGFARKDPNTKGPLRFIWNRSPSQEYWQARKASSANTRLALYYSELPNLNPKP